MGIFVSLRLLEKERFFSSVGQKRQTRKRKKRQCEILESNMDRGRWNRIPSWFDDLLGLLPPWKSLTLGKKKIENQTIFLGAMTASSDLNAGHRSNAPFFAASKTLDLTALGQSDDERPAYHYLEQIWIVMAGNCRKKSPNIICSFRL